MKTQSIDASGFLNFITREHWAATVRKAKRIRRVNRINAIIARIKSAAR